MEDVDETFVFSSFADGHVDSYFSFLFEEFGCSF
jgi:hypothetical protein